MADYAACYATNDYAESNRLFEEHLFLVKKIAHHVCLRLPPGYSLDDLVQVGMIGLMEASRVYDPTQGASFKSYASIRIRGAILDELRKQSWLPRSVQKKAREVSQAVQNAEKRLGRAPTDREIADEMNATLEAYNGMLEAVSGCGVFSLDDENFGPEPEDNGGHPLQLLQDEALREKLAEVIAELPGREKLVISLYYDNELNLKEIGAVLEVSESRVCQIHTQAVARIRAKMRAWLGDESDHGMEGE